MMNTQNYEALYYLVVFHQHFLVAFAGEESFEDNREFLQETALLVMHAGVWGLNDF